MRSHVSCAVASCDVRRSRFRRRCGRRLATQGPIAAGVLMLWGAWRLTGEYLFDVALVVVGLPMVVSVVWRFCSWSAHQHANRAALDIARIEVDRARRNTTVRVRFDAIRPEGRAVSRG